MEKVTIVVLVLILILGCNGIIWRCKESGYGVVPNDDIRQLCDEDQERNSVRYMEQLSNKELEEILLSSVLMLKLRIERVFNKKTSWTSCVMDGGRCGSQFCQLMARKHYLQIYVECVQVYTNYIDGDSQCLSLYNRIYISSFCHFDEVREDETYLLFASEVTLQSSGSSSRCGFINEITYTHIFEYNSDLYDRALDGCHQLGIPVYDRHTVEPSKLSNQCVVPQHLSAYLMQACNHVAVVEHSGFTVIVLFVFNLL